MSYRVSASSSLPVSRSQDDGSSSSDLDDDDDDCADWQSDVYAQPTQSLFDDTTHPTPQAALAHDRGEHDFDLQQEAGRLMCDVYGRTRLVNLIRKEHLSVHSAKGLAASDERLRDDTLLVPIISNDPLLRELFLKLVYVFKGSFKAELDFDDSWSDAEDFVPAGPSKAARASTPDVNGHDTESSDRLASLQAELDKARADLATLRTVLRDSMADDESGDDGSATRLRQNAAGAAKGKGKGKAAVRDDDTHYFDSYAENDIHEVMLRDTTRTMSYAKFISSNPQVFKGAVVLDVGCGTGILSMFAARAGAKHVYAVEASGLASKTRENVRRNNLDSVISVIQGKVEDIALPVDKVDVIISEWMGYMLLYESMLDSVLRARDRFLRTGGLMIPSQTRLVLSAIRGDKVVQDNVGFWGSVYGFDMSPMSSACFDEGIIDIVDDGELVTNGAIVKDINTHFATVKSLDFTSDFILHSSSPSNETMRAFLTHFDTFFSPHGGPDASHVLADHAVDLAQYPDEDVARPVQARPGGRGGVQVSFTTGPRGKATHWKQVVFLLRDEITLRPGEGIRGRFFCRKSATNSRELDVEIHFAKLAAGTDDLPADAVFTVQTFKVR